MPINYQQKAREIFIELFHEPWMTEKDFHYFETKAIAHCNYGTKNFARDLEKIYKPIHEIENRLNEVKQKVKI